MPFKNSLIDKTLLKYLLYVFLAAYLIDFLGSALYYYFNSPETFAKLNFKVLIIKYFINYGLKFLFIITSIRLTINTITLKKNRLKGFIIHIFLAFLLSFYTATNVMILERYVFNGTVDITLESVWIRGLSALNYNFFVYSSLLGIVYAYYYLKEQQKTILNQERLKTQLLDTKINALQSQLQPHFLFNALNDISSLIDIDMTKSQNAIADLSDLLRSTLNIKDQKLIELDDELSMLNKYLDIEKLRFAEKLNFEIKVSKTLFTKKVPPLLLQPFIENCIKHGFSYKNNVLTIILNIYALEDALVFKITNDGKPLENDQPIYGNGISNVLQRLDSLYGARYTFEMVNKKQGANILVETTIEIPVSITSLK